MADARHVINVILNARDNTGEAFASAAAKLGAFQKLAEANKREANAMADQWDAANRKIGTSIDTLRRHQKQLHDDVKQMSKQSIDAQVALEKAARAYGQAVLDQNRSQAERIQALQDLQEAEKKFVKLLQAEESQQGQLGEARARVHAQDIRNGEVKIAQEQTRLAIIGRIAKEEERLAREAAERDREQAQRRQELADLSVRAEEQAARAREDIRQAELEDIKRIEAERRRTLEAEQLQAQRRQELADLGVEAERRAAAAKQDIREAELEEIKRIEAERRRALEAEQLYATEVAAIRTRLAEMEQEQAAQAEADRIANFEARRAQEEREAELRRINLEEEEAVQARLQEMIEEEHANAERLNQERFEHQQMLRERRLQEEEELQERLAEMDRQRAEEEERRWEQRAEREWLQRKRREEQEERERAAEAELADLREHLQKREQEQAAEAEAKRIANWEARQAQIQRQAQEEEAAARAREDRERQYQAAIQRTLEAEMNLQRARAAGGAGIDVPTTTMQRFEVEDTEARMALDQMARQIRELDGKEINVKADIDHRRFLAGSRDIDRALRDNERSARQHTSAFGVMGLALGKLVGEFRNGGNSIASFDNMIRGLFTLGITVFLQQLIQIAAAAAGALAMLASSALFAAGALGGALVAGAAQAIPVIGLLATAATRMGKVFEAVKQQNLFQEQQSYAGNKALNAQVNALDGVRSAQEALADSQRGVVQAQERVTEAREQARRQLQDLILAEKQAELAARGAALAQEDAQAALRRAVQQGATADIGQRLLGIDEAALSRRQAGQRLGRVRSDLRAARSGADPGVARAEESLRDSERAAARAQRALERARRTATQTVENVSAAQGKLNYLMADLSAAERAMYEAVLRLTGVWRDFAKTAAEPLINSFTFAIGRVTRILQDDRMVAASRRLSSRMATGFDRVFEAFTSPTMLAQFRRIMDQAGDNMRPLSRIAINLGRAFADIAEAAGPALNRLLNWVDQLTKSFANAMEQGRRTGDLGRFFQEGVTHIQAWVRLLRSVARVFLAIAGPGGGAREGLGFINDMTAGFERMAKAIRTPGSEANKFFNDFFRLSREMLSALRPVATAMGREFRRIFTADGLESVRGFSNFMSQVLIPALGKFIRLIGAGTAAIGNFADQNPAVAKLIASFIALSLTIGTFGKVMTIFAPFTRSIGFLILRMAGFKTGAELAGAAMARLGTIAKGIGFGTVGVFAAIAGAIVFVLVKLGLLDDVFRGIGQLFAGFFAGVMPAIRRLGDAFGDIGGSLGTLREDAAVVGRAFVTAMRTIGEFFGKGLGNVIDLIVGHVRTLVALFRGDLKGAIESVKQTFENIFNSGGVEGEARRIADAIKTNSEKMKEAEDKLADSQRDAAAAQRELTDARKQARRELADLRSRAEGGRLSIREARFNVEDAEKELNVLRARGASTDEIRRAELRLDQARLNLKDTTRQAKRDEEDYAEAQKKGVRGNPQVVAATKRASEARKKAIRDQLAVWEEVRKGFERIEEAKDYEDIGEKMAKGIVKGFKNWIWNLDTHLKNAVVDMMNSALEKLGIKSASTWAIGVGKNIVAGFVQGLAGLPGAIVDKIRDILPKIPGIVADLAGKAWNAVKDFFGGPDEASASSGSAQIKKPAPIPNVLAPKRRGGEDPDAAKRRAEVHVTSNMRAFAAEFRRDWSAILQTTRRNSNAVADEFREMRVAIERTMTRLSREFHERWRRMADISISSAERIWKGVRSNVNNLQNTVFTGMNYIANATNKALTSFDADPIRLRIPRPGGAEGRAMGGFVGQPGERGRDMIPAWIGRGEAVLNHWQQRAVQASLRPGLSLHDVIMRTRGYHAGGPGQPGFAGGYAGRIPGDGLAVPIPGQPGEYIAKRIVGGVVSMMRRYKMAVTDGFALSGHASGGDHPKGLAADFVPGRGGNWDLVDQAAAYARTRLGKVFRWIGYDGVEGHGRGHHLHLSWLSDAKGLGAAMIEQIKRLRVLGAIGPLRTLAQRAVDMARKGANKMLEGQMDSGEMTSHPTGDNLLSRGEVMSVINRAMDLAGVPEALRAQWRSMAYDRARQESGFNPNAINRWDINAQRGTPSIGLFQTIGPTFLSHMLRGMSNIRNPLHNAVAAFRYMFANYGGGESWQLALSRMLGRRGIGYATGGIIPGDYDGAPQPILAHAGEWVLNRRQQLALARLAGTTPGKIKMALGFSGGPTSFQGGGEVGGPARSYMGDMKGGDAAQFRRYDRQFDRIRTRLIDQTLMGALATLQEIAKGGIKKAERSAFRRAQLYIGAGLDEITERLNHANINTVIAARDEVRDLILRISRGKENRNETKLLNALKKLQKEANDSVMEGLANLSIEALQDFERRTKQRIRRLERGREDAGQNREIARLRALLRNATASLLQLPTLMPTGFNELALLGGRARVAMRRFGGNLTKFTKAVRTLTDEGGLLESMSSAIEAGAARATADAQLARAGLVRATETVRRWVGRGRRRRQVVVSRAGDLVARPGGRADEAEVARLEEANLQQQAERQRTLRNQAQDALRAVNSQIQRQQRRGASPRQLAPLIAARNKLVNDITAADQKLAETLNSVYEAVRARIEADTNKAVRESEKITKAAEFFERWGQILGVSGETINNAIRLRITGLEKQMAAYQEGARRAAETGNEELAREYTQQAADIFLSIQEANSQILQNQLSDIEKAAQGVQNTIERRRRVATAFGRSGEMAGFIDEEGTNLVNQQAQLAVLLNEARRTPNVGLQGQLADQIAEIDTKLQELAAQRMSQVAENMAKAFSQGMAGIDTAARIATAFGRTGEVGELQAKALEMRQARQTELEGLIASAIQAGNVGLAESLTSELQGLQSEIAEGVVGQVSFAREQVNRAAQRQQTALDIRNRIAQALGQTDVIQSLFADRISNARDQITALKATLVRAQKAGAVGLAEEIQDQINDLETSIIELGAQRLQGTVDAINRAAQRRQSAVEIRSRIAQALGQADVIQTLFADRIKNAQLHIKALQDALTEADRAGAVGLAEQLRDQITDLQTSIVEMTAQQLQGAIEAINNEAQRARARIDLRGRAADLMQRMGNSIGAATMRLANLEQMGNVLARQRAGLYGQLATAREQGNVGVILSLEDAIADLEQQIAENTAAIADQNVLIRQTRIDQIQGRAGARGGIQTGVQTLLTSLGNLTGQLDIDRMRRAQQRLIANEEERALGLREQLLAGFGIDLANLSGTAFVDAVQSVYERFDLLTAGMSEQQRSQFDALITAVIENENAITQNTQQLNELNGHYNQPQSFSSAAWQQMRYAIFNGMGGLLPQYQVPSMQTGGYVTRAGLFHLHQGEFVVNPERSNVPNAGDINIEINEAGRPLDITGLAARLAFEKKTR